MMFWEFIELYCNFDKESRCTVTEKAGKKAFPILKIVMLFKNCPQMTFCVFGVVLDKSSKVILMPWKAKTERENYIYIYIYIYICVCLCVCVSVSWRLLEGGRRRQKDKDVIKNWWDKVVHIKKEVKHFVIEKSQSYFCRPFRFLHDHSQKHENMFEDFLVDQDMIRSFINYAHVDHFSLD